MEYLKKSFAFFGKHILAGIPLLVALIIPLFIMGAAIKSLTDQMPQIIQTMISQASGNPMDAVSSLLSMMQSLMGSLMLGGFFSTVLSLLAYPITAGLIKNGLAGEETGFDKYVDVLKENFIQYLLYIVGGIIVGLIAGIGLIIVSLILGIILGLLGTIGGILGVLIGIAACVFLIYFSFRLFPLWLPAMIIDKAGIFEGLKKGFEASKGSFWLLFLVIVLTFIATGIVQFILGFLTNVVVIGPIVSGAISTAAAFLLLIFTMIVYKEKSSGAAEPASDAGTDQ